MSVFSVASIDRFIEPAPASSSSRSPSMERESLNSNESRPPFSFYPPLYVTPAQQRPPSPSSLSSSPYLLNYKRRCPVQNGSIANTTAESQTIDVQKEAISPIRSGVDDKERVEETISISMPGIKLERLTEGHQDRNYKTFAENESSSSSDVNNGFTPPGSRFPEDKGTDSRRQLVGSEVLDTEIMSRDFSENSQGFGAGNEGNPAFDARARRDSRAAKEINDKYPCDRRVGAGCEGTHRASSSASRTSEEFFDAPDFPFDESTADDETGLSSTTVGMSPSASNEKMTTRLQLETARRLKAEAALASLRMQWNELARTSFLPPVPCEGGLHEQDANALQELVAERLSVARLVAAAIATASVRAVKEEELESIATAKNREISRLRDKLQYYELINHEMSQRNQEAIEIAQRRKRRRHKRQKWALGCFCAAFCIGTTGFLCYKIFPWEHARTWTKSFINQGELDSIDKAST